MAGTLILQPFANVGDKSTPPQTDGTGFVNWNQGYTPDYEINLTVGNPQAKAVERAVQNALFNILTANQQEWQQLGFSEWYASMPGGYPKNAQVVRLDGTGVWLPFRSLIAANVSDPLLTPAQWEYTPSAAEMLTNIPMRAGGAGGSTAEIVSVATNFNTFTTGTWEFQTDAIAAASANSPAVPGGTAQAGMLESKAWGVNPNAFVVQRYTNRNGVSFFRGATNGVWTSWNTTAPVQTYSVDTSATPNLVSATFPLASAILADNQQFWVKVANTNTGASTFTPNPGVIAVPLAVVGQGNAALQGNELVVGGRALFIYKADTNNFVLAFCSGGALQVATASKSLHAVGLSQARNEINAYAVDTGAVNAYQAVFDSALNVGNILDNQRFWLKPANANTGASTFTPNPGTFAPAAIVGESGLALQGGEIGAAGRILLVWKANTANFALVDSVGGSVPVPDGTQSRHAVNLGQTQALISAGGADGALYRLGLLM